MTQNEPEDLERLLTALGPTIRRAARSVAFQWPGVADTDDVEQAIRLRLWESPGSLERVSEMEERARYRAIVGIGHQLASAERADYDHFKGSYRYSVAEAKDVLKRGVLIAGVDGFDDFVFDLMEALQVLGEKSPQYFGAITKRYADEETPAAGAAQKRLSDALTSLVDAMNRSNKRRYAERDDGPGTRQRLTRAQAYASTGSDWEGDE